MRTICTIGGGLDENHPRIAIPLIVVIVAFVFLMQAGSALVGSPILAAQTEAGAIRVQIEDLLNGGRFNELAVLEVPNERGAREEGLAMRLFATWMTAGNRPALEAALFRLAAEGSRSVRDPWPRYLAARVHLSLNAMDAPVLSSAGQLLGESHLDAAIRHLSAALEIDPEMRQAQHLLAQIAYASGDREPRAHVREAVVQAVLRTTSEPDLYIVAARWHRIERRYSNSVQSLIRAFATGADPSVVALELSRSSLALGDTAAAAAHYWTGVAQLSSKGRDLYRQDLAALLSPDSLAAFERLRADEVAEWLRRFWAERDAAAANQPGERLVEHLRRWVVVHERYRVPLPWQRDGFSRVDLSIEGFPPCVGNATAFYEQLPIHPSTLTGDPRYREPLLDHRALVYLRHGEPFAITRAGGVLDRLTTDTEVGSRPPVLDDATETDVDLRDISPVPGQLSTWVYWIDEGWRTFNFQGSDALGRYAPTTLVSFLPLVAAAWDALGTILPDYADTRGSCTRKGAAAVRRQRADAYLATTADSDTPPIAGPWNAPIRIHGISAGPNDGKVLVTYALPGTKLTVDTIADLPAWRMGFRIMAYERGSGRTVVLDTVRHFAAHPVADNDYVIGYLELPLTAGDWNIAIRAWQGSGETVGVYSLRRGITIGGAGALVSSDLVIGVASGLPWRGTDGFRLNPLGVWSDGRALDLWYQLHGMVEGERYRLRIELHSTDSAKRTAQPVIIESEEQADGSPMLIRRSIGVDLLQEGTYQVTITVRTATAEQRGSAEVTIAR